MGLTRAEKILKARELRTEGLTAPEIATVLGVCESTIRNWYLGAKCEACGAPTTKGYKGHPETHCDDCARIASRFWTSDQIIESMREWAEQYGTPPSVRDWNPALAVRQGGDVEVYYERYEAGCWPNTSIVQLRFGSWNAAMSAAGFIPCEPGHYREEYEAA